MAFGYLAVAAENYQRLRNRPQKTLPPTKIDSLHGGGYKKIGLFDCWNILQEQRKGLPGWKFLFSKNCYFFEQKLLQISDH